MMEEHGVCVDRSSINRWAIRFLRLLEKVFRKHKRPVGGSWRMDETYIKVRVSGNICTAQWTRKAKRSTFC
jgi:putative transposase